MKLTSIGRTLLSRSVSPLLLVAVIILLSVGRPLDGQQASFVIEHGGTVLSLEPYAPNILRVTLSTKRAWATSSPGYGFEAKSSAAGWIQDHNANGDEVYRSSDMAVHIALGSPLQYMPLDTLNRELRRQYFSNFTDPTHDDSLTVATSDGKTLLHLHSWRMVQRNPAETDGDSYRIAATFDSPRDEHYYGLGQQQKGWMDLRDHQIRCWHDYSAIGGEDVCVPFMVSSMGYGLVWDNPSKTTIDLGFNGQNIWSSEVGDRV